MIPRTGTIELGSFRLLGLLGEGSFASAYLAEQIGTERQAVVKIAHPHLLARASASTLRERFQDEVRASTRVQHPNLATIFTTGETSDGLPAIAMEFVPGDSLEACLERDAPVSPNDLVYFGQITSVLAALHRVNIIHRDVTPANVMVTVDHDGAPRAMLLDFGIAQLGDSANSGGAMGTPRYAPPEQVAGRTVPASDMYGLGAMLWWALTGSPYLNAIDTLDRLLSHQMHMASVPDPRSINPNIAPDLAETTMALLNPDPSCRPTSAELLQRWPSIIADGRRWRRQNRHKPSTMMPAANDRRDMRVLVVDPHPVKRHLVSAYAERLGCAVTVTEDPRQATRGALGSFDLAVVATELGRVDSTKVAKHLREHFPDQRLLLMSSEGERVVTPSDCGADIHLHLPGELGRFGEYLNTFQQRTRNSGRTPLRTLEENGPLDAAVLESWRSRPTAELQEMIRSFIGAMPTLITQLDFVPGTGAKREVRKSCELIHARATSLGASHLARLAQSMQMLLDADALPNPAAFVSEIENEYVRVFRDLRQLIHTNE